MPSEGKKAFEELMAKVREEQSKTVSQVVSEKAGIAGQLATGALYDLPTGIVGLPGDVGRIMYGMGKAADYPNSYIPSPFTAIGAGLSYLPSSQDVREFASDITGFDPRPYGELSSDEKLARTTGAFLPNAATGVKNVITRGAPKALSIAENLAQRAKNVFVPAATSEVLGQATEGSSLEPVARFVGALLGSRAASGKPTPQEIGQKIGVPIDKAAADAAAKSSSKLTRRGTPSPLTLKQQTDMAYSELRGAGINYNVDAFRKSIDDAISSMKREGIYSESLLKTAQNLRGVKQGELDWTTLDAIRRNLNKVAYGGQTDEASQLAARVLIEKISDLETSPNFFMSAGAKPLNPAEISLMTQKARDLASRRIKTRQINDVIELAPTYAGTLENNLRSGFSRLLRDIKKGESKNWTKEEIAAIDDVANGRKVVQALSRLAPTWKETLASKGVAAGVGLASATVNPLLPVLQGTVGAGSRIASGLRTQEAARRAAGFTSMPKLDQQRAIELARRAQSGAAQRMFISGQAARPGLLSDENQ